MPNWATPCVITPQIERNVMKIFRLSDICWKFLLDSQCFIWQHFSLPGLWEKSEEKVKPFEYKNAVAILSKRPLNWGRLKINLSND